ncbi:DUF5074 domain-containing protein [Formosa sp. S-31]|uniref:DUF5074 domain-containing protein n=1 Tax=Formosa sp. S-31 TaxID=2790949 RepID=UPI003EB938F0
MKRINKFILLSCISLSLFSSCSSDDDGNDTPNLPKGTYDNGYFIINEGGSDPSTASISFISEDNTLNSDIYRTENPNASETGSYLQSMFFDDTRAFIISGQANQITVVDRYTFEYITTLDSDFTAPRYGVVIDDTAYVTNSNGWDDGSDDFITIINLNDYSTSKLALGITAEAITEANDIIYISNGYYGAGQTITVLDPKTNTTQLIDLGEGNAPNSFEIQNGNLFVLTNNAGSNSNIFKINIATNAISQQMILPTLLADAKQLDIEDNTIYFTNNTSVFKVSTSGDEDSFGKVLEYTSTSDWGAMYGFAVNNGTIYIADAGDFISNGTTFEFSLNGNQLNSYVTGISPNSFYFNN